MAETIFEKGDKVREIKFGETYTVVCQRGSLMVPAEELSNAWIYPGNLRLVTDRADDLVNEANEGCQDGWIA